MVFRHVIRVVLVALLMLPASVAAHEIQFFLGNAGGDPDARARVRFDADDEAGPEARQRLEVKVEALDSGDYEVFVGGVSVGSFVANDEGEGRLRLEGTPLDVDPRDQLLEVKSDPAGDLFFTGTLPASRDEARRRIKVRDDFANTGAEPRARGEARLRSRQGETRFEVRVKNLPAGTYDLLVNGTDVADLEVVLAEGSTAGALKFDSRFARGNKRLLTFDPLCQSLAISETVDTVPTTLLTVEQFGASADVCAP
jgi:hypothetical protein